MEKKLKPFDLEAAKAGKPVVTQQGSPARIICFDRLGEEFPIVTLIVSEGYEFSSYHTSEGKNVVACYDLFMAPEKKTVWVNICEEAEGFFCSNRPFSTKEDALSVYYGDLNSSNYPLYIGTYPITIEI